MRTQRFRQKKASQQGPNTRCPQIAFELVTWIITARFEFHYQNDILGLAFRNCHLFENGWPFQKYGILIKLYYKSIRTEVREEDISNPEPQVPNHCQKIGEWVHAGRARSAPWSAEMVGTVCSASWRMAFFSLWDLEKRVFDQLCRIEFGHG